MAAASELNDGLDRLAPPNERTEKEGLGIGKDQGWCGVLKSVTVLTISMTLARALVLMNPFSSCGGLTYGVNRRCRRGAEGSDDDSQRQRESNRYYIK